MKSKIATALLDMNKSVEWKKILDRFNVWGFKTVSPDLYNQEKEIRELVKDMSVNAIYY